MTNADEIIIDSRELLKLVETKPVLWDIHHNGYGNIEAKPSVWKEVASQLIPIFDGMDEAQKKHVAGEVTRKWITLKVCYRQSIQRFEEHCAKGDTTPFRPYIHAKNMQFLDKLYNPKKYNFLSSSEQAKILNISFLEKEFDYRLKINPDPNSRQPRIRNRSKAKKSVEKRRVLKFTNFSPTTNRHVAFLQSILPTLDTFDGEEILEYEKGVLKLLKNYKNGRQNESPSRPNNPVSCVSGLTATRNKQLDELDARFQSYGEDSD